jgi:hypothetical protein
MRGLSRPSPAALVLALLAALAPSPAVAGQIVIAAQAGVLPVRVSEGSAASPEGVCVAVAAQPRGSSWVVYLVTSARLVGDGSDWTARVELGGETLVVSRDQVLIDPGGTIAILRAISATPPTTVPVFLERVPTGSPVVAAGFRPGGDHVLAAAHLHRQAMASGLVFETPGQIDLRPGTPVLIDRGVLALASGGADARQAAVQELAAHQTFLEQNVPGLAPEQSPGRVFTRADREISGPTLEIPMDRTAQGEIDVPLDLDPRETVIGASARFVTRTPLRLGDLTIVSLDSRRVRLRFALGGEPQPTLSAPWPPAQALVVLRVTLVSEATRP